MIRLRRIAVTAMTTFALASALGACASAEHVLASPSATLVQETPQSVVDAFSNALRAGDATIVQRLMAPDVIIAESGEVERSFDEYASHHLPADIAFMGGVQVTLEHRDVIVDRDMATVISRAQVHGQFRNRPIHSNSMETMVLKRTDGHWRIVHVHWSSSPISESQ